MLSAMMLVALLWIAVIAPDSPQFLYESEKFDQLEKAFTTIAKFNCIYNKSKIDAILIKLKAQSEADNAAKAAEADLAVGKIAENKTK